MSRPRKYSCPEEFQAAAEGYFTRCEMTQEPPTIAGLAFEMGFADRQSFSEYEGYGDEFSLTVKRARLRIEGDRSKRLLSKDSFTPGVIFDLKNNHGWRDKSEQELSGPDGGPIQVSEIVLRGVRSQPHD